VKAIDYQRQMVQGAKKKKKGSLKTFLTPKGV
jgi:hypothetical protein